MFRLWLLVTRALRIGVVAVPLFIAYGWLWFRSSKLHRPAPAARWRQVHQRHAKRFLRLANTLRGGLIKVGQILSTRIDLLPREWTDELATLQDKVAPSEWKVIEEQLRQSYGTSLDRLFETIDPKAEAAASFGQVHRATTSDGQEVALKVRYPNIETKLDVDLRYMRTAARLFNLFIPKVGLKSIYSEVSRALQTELNYVQEAEFTRIVHENFRSRASLHIPEVFEEYSAQDVICTSWFEGKKITDVDLLSDPRIDRRLLLERLLQGWIEMMYVDGVFQSDPHPGNLLVGFAPNDDGFQICVVDFGQVKILPQAFHQKLVSSVMAFALGNQGMFVDSLVAIGLFSDEDRPTMEPIVIDLMERIRSKGKLAGSIADFQELREELLSALERMEGVVIPQELVLYGRTFALLAGVARAVAPDVNAIELAKPLVTDALLAGGPPEDPLAS